MMDAATRRLVRDRAGNACEYCGLRQEHSPLVALQFEHVRPRKHGGDDSLDNLALACIDCNLAKGSNLSGIDPLTQQIASLFDPRRQHWADHFEWHGAFLVGRTPTGRATIDVLRMNSEEQVQLRLSLQVA